MNINNINLVTEVSNSYLEYSLASIARAIPDYRDGLLPVYRRIVWAAKDGFSSASKHKKSAKLSGEVMGNYHPHSDNYGSIVSLTTTYNQNYPIMDGQGSFGDSTSPAASSRYTEVRLQKFTEDVLLDELESLDLKPNYDGTSKEPIFLNSKLPILLLRGSNSISVGFATHTPQYNLGEISKYLLGDKTISKLLPDFPTGCDISEDINNPNTIIMRARILNKTSEIIGKRKKKEYVRIEFSNLPSNTNPEKIGEQIRKLAQTERILTDDIIAVNDLSDRNGDCLEVVLVKEREREILSTLWKYTDLQSQFSINFTVLVDGIPKTMDPISYLDLWKSWRLEKISLYYKLILGELEKESLLLKEIILVLDNKKDLIEILDNPKNTLAQCREKIKNLYKISNESVDFFLNLPIKKLIHLEIQKYKVELEEVEKKINFSKSVIKNPSKQFEKEIQKYVKEYGLERKSKIISLTIAKQSEVEKNPTLSAPIKRTFSLDYKSGKTKKGSEFCEPILIIGSDGKLYRISPNNRVGPIGDKTFKILYSIKESEKNNSNDILLLEDRENSLAKRVKITDLSATNKGTPLGFESITHVGIKNNSPIKIKGKGAKPQKI
jgi:DNA gyrase subunit A